MESARAELNDWLKTSNLGWRELVDHHSRHFPEEHEW